MKVREIGTNTTKTLWTVNGSANATASSWAKALVNIGERSLFRVSTFLLLWCVSLEIGIKGGTLIHFPVLISSILICIQYRLRSKE